MLAAKPIHTASGIAKVGKALADLVTELGMPIACVDLETTGLNAARDRITEVGLVLIDAGGRVDRWSSLVDPQCWIPPEITCLTGIDAEAVAGAPTFRNLADELLEKLDGRILVAHNARFDTGFLRQSLHREGIAFAPRVLCSVKLSRALFPRARGHGLDAVTRRLGLACEARHRAPGDVQVVADFLARMAETRLDDLLDACRAQWRTPALPAHIPTAMVEQIPDNVGVYLIYGENDLPIYIGKSVHLRRRVLDHFRNDHRQQREMRLAQQARRIDWIETPGELSALLLESRLIKERSPVLNRRLRQSGDLSTIAWHYGSDSPPRIVSGQTLDPEESHGAFRTKREAQKRLRTIAAENGLCDIRLGFQTGAGPCFARQLERCRGVCVGKEKVAQHDLRLAEALQSLRIARWPFPGAIGVVEQNEHGRAFHIIDRWIHLGEAEDEPEAFELIAGERPAFDIDTYRILLRFLSNQKNEKAIWPLQGPHRGGNRPDGPGSPIMDRRGS